MNNDIKYHDRDVILSDAQIEKIVNDAKKEQFTNHKSTHLSMYEREKITNPFVPKPKIITEEDQEFIRCTISGKSTSITEKIISFFKGKHT